jgi:hypothetical protein
MAVIQDERVELDFVFEHLFFHSLR